MPRLPCLCGCGKTPLGKKSLFITGHDGTLKSRVLKGLPVPKASRKYAITRWKLKPAPSLVNNYQRKDALSNAHAGREFEKAAQLFFKKTGIALQSEFIAQVGFKNKRPHKFDLGSDKPPILVACKSYTWTQSGNSPSAKITAINEAMLLFSTAPKRYRKILFMLKHMRKEISLGSHYIKQGSFNSSGD